jgi:hypothetical protein
VAFCQYLPKYAKRTPTYYHKFGTYNQLVTP